MPRSAGRSAGPPTTEPADPPTRAAVDQVPHHVAIIMDGNGRWAAEHGRRRIAGHRAGAETVREVVRAASEARIDVLTLYAFSSENWSRPAGEVAGLFRLLTYFLRTETPELASRGIRLRAIGRTAGLRPAVRAAIRRSEEATAAGTGMVLCLAINYGAQDELVDAARALAEEARGGIIGPAAIERADVERHLYTAGLPPVDLLIRTGGDVRVSNFLLWQVSYAELYFTPVCWPAFGREDFRSALQEYGRRQRRFGGL